MLQLPLTFSEMGWIAHHIQNYGWDIFDENFVLDSWEQERIKEIREQVRLEDDLWEILDIFNEESRARKETSESEAELGM